MNIKKTLLLLIIFCIGTIFGVVLTKIMFHHNHHNFEHEMRHKRYHFFKEDEINKESIKEIMKLKLSRKLNLSENQKIEIFKIIDDFDPIFSELREKNISTIEKMDSLISTYLTEEQQEKLKNIKNRIYHKKNRTKHFKEK